MTNYITDVLGTQRLTFGEVPGVVYRAGKLKVIVSRDDGLWHLSISHPTRLPTWAEICDARYSLLPDEADMMMALPPKAEYVNLHPFCMHLFETAHAG